MTDVRYTEKFLSVQGEGRNTGKLCTWLRLFACSLQCAGFGQPDPADKTTWIKPIDFNPKDKKSLSEIPTPKYGCDSAYSISGLYKHLATEEKAKKVARQIVDMTPNKSFMSESKNPIGHVFTGGEPLMQQDAIIKIIDTWIDDGDWPAWITFETNGTQKLTEEFKNKLLTYQHQFDIEITFSASPKLLHVSGEKPEKAIKIDIIKEYAEYGNSYLKFVLNADDRAWQQAEEISKQLDMEVWVMPVGGVVEQQTDPIVGKIADRAIFDYGWNVSARTHVYIWGNDQMGR